MNYEAVLFDLDGTLLDTLEDIANSTNNSLRRLGFLPLDTESYRALIGEGREALAERALPPDSRHHETVSKLVHLINEEYSQHWGDNTRLYQGISGLLDELAGRRIKTAVLSNKADEFTGLIVARLLDRWNFDIIAGALPTIPKKPDPTAALQIAAQMGIDTRKFIYLGDSGTDMTTAVRANMYPAGALWGFRSAEELLSAGARTLVRHPRELLDLL